MDAVAERGLELGGACKSGKTATLTIGRKNRSVVLLTGDVGNFPTETRFSD